jgi:transcriptional regulator with XRE-family HTH domain
MKHRTHSIKLTNEARLLRSLRGSKGLSMRVVGELCGKTGSYISQIEHGRMNVPKGEDLKVLLDLYEVPSVDDFNARASKFKETITDKDEIFELLEKTNKLETSIVLKFVKALVASEGLRLLGVNQ